MNKTARNEERKLVASYFNGVAIGVLAVGLFAPLVSFVQTGILLPSFLFLGAGCLAVSVALHFLGRDALRSIEE